MVALPQTNVRDATDGWNTLLAALGASSIVDGDGGTWRHRGTILARSLAGLDLSRVHTQAVGTGASAQPWDGKPSDWPRDRASWIFDSCTYPHLHAMAICGGNLEGLERLTLEGQAGVRFSACASPTLLSSVIGCTWGDAVTLSNRTVDALIAGLHAGRLGRHGVGLTDADGTHIVDSVFDGFQGAGVDIEPWRSDGAPADDPGQTVSGATIENCTFKGGKYVVTSGGSGRVVEDVRVLGCHKLDGPFLAKIGSPGRVTRRVTFDGCGGLGGGLILLNRVEEFEIVNCPGVEVRESTPDGGSKKAT